MNRTTLTSLGHSFCAQRVQASRASSAETCAGGVYYRTEAQ